MEFQSTSTDSVVEPCAVEALADLDRLGDEIAELAVHLSAATARLLDLIREFDARGGWNHGFRSCAAWLTWRVGFSSTTAREHVRVARALGGLPRLAQALARGELSYSKVQELTRVAQPETEAQLLAVGRAGTAEHVERLVRAWRWMDSKAEAREAAQQHASRSLQVYPDADGTVRIRGRLAPEVGAVLLKALAAARETLYQVLADADQPGQSVLEDGGRVPAGASQRLACDASRVIMRHDAEGRVVEVGARTRTIPPAFRRALQYRDGGCRFPGCGVRFGQGHHIRHWTQGGPTTLANLAILCRRHHRAVHEEGVQVEREPDGELRFRGPAGQLLPEVPPAPCVADEPLGVLRAWHQAAGLDLHAHTATPGWLGERLDVGYAIDVLHPRAIAPPAES